MNNSTTLLSAAAQNCARDFVSPSESEPATAEQWLKLAVLTVCLAALAGVLGLIVWYAKLHPVGSILVCTTFLWTLAVGFLDFKG